MEQQSRDLRQQQRGIKDGHEDASVQKHIFRQLEELIKKKLSVLEKQSGAGYGGYGGADYGMRPAIDMSQGAVNRIVIGE